MGPIEVKPPDEGTRDATETPTTLTPVGCPRLRCNLHLHRIEICSARQIDTRKLVHCTAKEVIIGNVHAGLDGSFCSTAGYIPPAGLPQVDEDRYGIKASREESRQGDDRGERMLATLGAQIRPLQRAGVMMLALVLSVGFPHTSCPSGVRNGSPIGRVCGRYAPLLCGHAKRCAGESFTFLSPFGRALCMAVLPPRKGNFCGPVSLIGV